MSTLQSPPEVAEHSVLLGEDDRLPAVDGLLVEAIKFVRMIHLMKTQYANRSAQSLLFPLAAAGPQRLSALAEHSHIDPSTVSRQVAELVKEDLVRRDADPDDGRACLLVVTPAGHQRLDQLQRERSVAMSEALSDWSAEEISTFTGGLRRFSEGLAGVLGLATGAQAHHHVESSSGAGPHGRPAHTSVKES